MQTNTISDLKVNIAGQQPDASAAYCWLSCFQFGSDVACILYGRYAWLLGWSTIAVRFEFLYPPTFACTTSLVNKLFLTTILVHLARPRQLVKGGKCLVPHHG